MPAGPLPESIVRFKPRRCTDSRCTDTNKNVMADRGQQYESSAVRRRVLQDSIRVVPFTRTTGVLRFEENGFQKGRTSAGAPD